MTAINCILCPTDFSEASVAAWQYAERLASETGASLILAHAFDGREAAETAQARQRLETVPLAYSQVKVQRILQPGAPGEAICWLAQEHGCNLIVMGLHGNTAIMDLLMGSVAEYVLRHARVPVLTLRKRAANEPPLEKPKIHLPTPAPRWM